MSQNKQRASSTKPQPKVEKVQTEAKKPDILIGTVTAHRLNHRAKPSFDAEIIEVLNMDDKVKIVGTEGEWYKTEKGYVASEFVKA